MKFSAKKKQSARIMGKSFEFLLGLEKFDLQNEIFEKTSY